MKDRVSTILLVAALACFFVGIFPVSSKINLMSLGLLCWLLSMLVR